jgi:hypothetical protein
MWLITLLNMRQYDTLILLDSILEMGNMSPFARKPTGHAWSLFYTSAIQVICFLTAVVSCHLCHSTPLKLSCFSFNL